VFFPQPFGMRTTIGKACVAASVVVLLSPTLRRVGFEASVPNPRHPTLGGENMTIPKHIHQFWTGPNPPTRLLAQCRAMHPGFNYTLWGGNNLPALANQRLYDAFGVRGIYHGQSDVVRYEVLYAQGGIWIDADMVCLRPLDGLLENGMFAGFQNLGNRAVQEGQWYHPRKYLVGTGVIGAVAGHPMMGELVSGLRNDASRARAPAWMSVGPGYFTRTLAANPGLWQGLRLMGFGAFTPYHHEESKLIVGDPRALEKVVEHRSYSMNLWGSTFNSYEAMSANKV